MNAGPGFTFNHRLLASMKGQLLLIAAKLMGNTEWTYCVHDTWVHLAGPHVQPYHSLASLQVSRATHNSNVCLPLPQPCCSFIERLGSSRFQSSLFPVTAHTTHTQRRSSVSRCVQPSQTSTSIRTGPCSNKLTTRTAKAPSAPPVCRHT